MDRIDAYNALSGRKQLDPMKLLDVRRGGLKCCSVAVPVSKMGGWSMALYRGEYHRIQAGTTGPFIEVAGGV